VPSQKTKGGEKSCPTVVEDARHVPGISSFRLFPFGGPQYAFNGAEQAGEGEKEEEMKQRSDYLAAILAGF
jgi:hypothetical protein